MCSKFSEADKNVLLKKRGNKLRLSWAKLSSNWNWNFVLLLLRFDALHIIKLTNTIQIRLQMVEILPKNIKVNHNISRRLAGASA